MQQLAANEPCPVRTREAREVVIDIETCVNNNGVGRILEVACVELLERGTKIGEKLHFYCNPGFDSDEEMHPAALKKHKLTVEFLMQYPTFAEQYDKLKEFLNGAKILCHGSVHGEPYRPFDTAVLIAECKRIGKPPQPLMREHRGQGNTNLLAKLVVEKMISLSQLNPEESWNGQRKFYSLSSFSFLVLKEDMTKTGIQHSAKHDADVLARCVIKSTEILDGRKALAVVEDSRSPPKIEREKDQVVEVKKVGKRSKKAVVEAGMVKKQDMKAKPANK